MPNTGSGPSRTVVRLSSLRARMVLLVILAVLPAIALILSSGRVVTDHLVAAAILAVVATGLAWAAADLFIVRRAKALVEATRRVAAGDLAARTGPPYGQGELGHLARAFDEMADSLQQRQVEAERQEAVLQRSLAALRATDEERRRLVAHLSQAQEQERGRIASDIHDDSIQAMTAVGIRLETLRRRVVDPGQLRVLEELEETVVLSIARLRHLLFELRPPVLDREGLAPALRVYLEEVSKEHGLTYDIVNQLEAEPPLEIRRILYRIAQEALSNVRKHARAAAVHVTLSEEGGGFIVRIRDDGVGFRLDTLQHMAPGHLGLAAMRERAEVAGGWWNLDTTRGGGTTVKFWLPSPAASTSPQNVPIPSIKQETW